MSYKILLKAFGIYVPYNHKYYRTLNEAQKVAERVTRDQLAGNTDLIKIVKVSENECIY